MKKTVLPVLALLALPAAAHADPIQCTDHDSGLQQSCTLTTQTQAPSGRVITSYTGTFSDNAQVGLRLMRRNADGTVTSDGSTGYTFVAAGRQTVEADLPIPAGDQFIALDLHSGTVEATPGGATIFAADHIFDDGETGSAGDAADYDLDLSVNAVDVVDPPASAGSSGSSDSTPPSSGGHPAGLSFDPRAVISPDGKSAEVYARNETGQSLSGTLRLKVGKTLYKAVKESDFDYSSSSDFGLWFGGKAAKKVLRKGSVRASIVAKMGSVSKTYPVKIIRGGARGFDGTYRGKGPVTIVVKNGVITAISEPMNTYCTQTGKFVMRSMMTGLGFPALVGKDGSFSHKASLGADSFTYKGTLSRTGTSKGYSSLWYSSFDLAPDTGLMRATQCVQASNWTATRK